LNSSISDFTILKIVKNLPNDAGSCFIPAENNSFADLINGISGKLQS
jgi:hypothetical protein